MQEITLHVSEKHYRMIAACAGFDEMTIEHWILWALAPDLRYVHDTLALERDVLDRQADIRKGIPFTEEDVRKFERAYSA